MSSLLFTNAKVFTGRGVDHFATAFRISDGEFSWVGDQSEVRGEEAIDLAGRTVLPGLLDVHTHAARMSTLSAGVDCLPPTVTSLTQLLDQLRSHPDLDAGRERWIWGRGYDESKFPEGTPPTRYDLDEVSTDQPVVVWRCDGHTAVCNSRALELAGITDETPDPDGARFGRDAQGRLNGMLFEYPAVRAVTDLMPAVDHEQQVRDLDRLSEHFFSLGITGVCDLLATVVTDPLRTFREAWGDRTKPRATLFYRWDAENPPADLGEDERRGRIRVGGVKLFMDGAYSNRTAWVNTAYPGSCEHGINTLSDESARAAVEWARRNKVQVAIHAMGDRALDHVVELFGDEDPWLRDRPSIRLEHATLVSQELMERWNRARMSFGVATHTNFLFAEYESYRRNLDSAQAAIAYPIRSMFDRVSYLALSSDCPATAWSQADDVFLSVKAAVVRRAYNGADTGQASAISVPQALLLYTGRAQQISDLGPVGKIEAGCEGSFVVLDRDVFTIDEDDIDRVRVAETWVNGVKVYETA
jgi:predicted amidohydrolase YtcJ